jgi:tetratricopeptide (TPR) repeat protein
MSDDENRMGFVRCKLPWIAGAGALLLFLVTLNHWVSLRSLPSAAKVAGWEWGLPLQAPLFYLVTYPIRWFPASVQALAMNGFTAICAALTLVLLARSVALLPHDRTHEQRLRERSDYSLLSNSLAWVPIILAVSVCALQLTFWEHATAITGEMFDLLIFAYVIRCLLEYRITLEDRWLAKMALLYGLGVTNNWALIAFFPLFLGALIWIRGIRFFEPAFLIQMVLLGFLGLLLYFFLPVLWMFKHEGDYSLFQILRANWASQKGFLADTPVLRNRVFLLSLTSVLPVFLMGIHWPSRSGETSEVGAQLTTVAFRIIHLFILAACLFVAFDPKFSPRLLGMGMPFLTFYYLGALAIGYYSGYALLVFSDPPRKSWHRDSPLLKILNPVVRAAVLLAMVIVPIALARQNMPRIYAADGSLLKDLVAHTVQTLPAAPAYLLTEDVYQLTLLQADLAARHRAQDYVLVNTRLLESPDYHELLRKHWGDRWPSLGTREELGSRVPTADIQRLILGLATSNRVAYLHPSFGYFFDVLYPEPNGAVYPLHPFAAEEVLPPSLTDNQLKANQAFWAGMTDTLDKIRKASELDSIDAKYVSQVYSRGLNNWGVQEQRNGKFAEAGKNFNSAFALNTNNLPAQINAQYNDIYVNARTTTIDINKVLEDKFGGVRSWDIILGENGPFDQPDFCGVLGDGFLVQTQYRQAALQFSRTTFFQPTNLVARLSLAKAYVYGDWVDKGMAEIEKIERDFKDRSEREKGDIVSLKAAAYYQKKDFPKAEEILLSARAKHPDDPGLNQALFELYRVSDKYTNALAVANEQLAKIPTNVVVLLQKAELQLNHDDTAGAHSTVQEVLKLAPKSGAALLFEAFVYIRETKYAQAEAILDKVLLQDPDNLQARLYQGIALMEQKQTDKALESFTKVLDKQPANIAALRNRAILNLRAKNLSDAKEDYQKLRKLAPKSYAVMYGLAEIAYFQKDYIAATHYYELYLKYIPAEPNSELQEERKQVQDRLKELKTLSK